MSWWKFWPARVARSPRSASPAYPKDLRERARVNELIDWVNVDFYRDFGYGPVDGFVGSLKDKPFVRI